jgi:hypothetical protein
MLVFYASFTSPALVPKVTKPTSGTFGTFQIHLSQKQPLLCKESSLHIAKVRSIAILKNSCTL